MGDAMHDDFQMQLDAAQRLSWPGQVDSKLRREEVRAWVGLNNYVLSVKLFDTESLATELQEFVS